MHVCMHAHMYVFVYVCVCVCMCMYVCMDVCMYVCIYVCVCVHVCYLCMSLCSCMKPTTLQGGCLVRQLCHIAATINEFRRMLSCTGCSSPDEPQRCIEFCQMLCCTGCSSPDERQRCKTITESVFAARTKQQSRAQTLFRSTQTHIQ